MNHYEDAFNELDAWLSEKYPEIHKEMLTNSIRQPEKFLDKDATLTQEQLLGYIRCLQDRKNSLEFDIEQYKDAYNLRKNLEDN